MKDFLDSTNTNPDLQLKFSERLSLQHCRIDQTPSPEELPLDPIEIKTDLLHHNISADPIEAAAASVSQTTPTSYHQEQQLSQTDSYSKTEQMSKSTTSKVSSNSSFITSITSITSLDTGYQGDGEMSRPASRGGDHSPSNVGRNNAAIIRLPPPQMVNEQQQQQNQNIPIVRRPNDPMTDSDFFTESDADDVVNRGGDRRAQVIDGQLYGPLLQHQANVYINRQPTSQTGDSCMESSGVFTDVENRGDEDLLQMRPEHDSDMSPDGSTDTVKSTIDQTKQADHQQQQQQQNNNNQVSVSSATVEENDGGDRLIISDVIIDGDVVAATAEFELKQHVDGAAATALLSRQVKAKAITSKVSATNIGDKLQSEKNVSTTGKLTKKSSPIRKQNKNEANTALKRHEFYAKRSGVGGGADGGHSGAVGGSCDSGKLIKASSSSSADLVADMENQENKRPVIHSTLLSSSSGSASPGGISNGGACASRKSPQNKWDAVMNKIAINKTVVKPKNYSDVKSKVTCGIGRRDMPSSSSPGLKSPAASGEQPQLLSSKRPILSSCSTKRYVKLKKKINNVFLFVLPNISFICFYLSVSICIITNYCIVVPPTCI